MSALPIDLPCNFAHDFNAAILILMHGALNAANAVASLGHGIDDVSNAAMSFIDSLVAGFFDIADESDAT